MLERLKERFKELSKPKPEELALWEKPIAEAYQILNYQIEITQKALQVGGEEAERLIKSVLNRVHTLQRAAVPAADRSWRLRCGQHIPLLKHPGYFYWPHDEKLQKGEYRIEVNGFGVNYFVNIGSLQNIENSWVLDREMVEDFADSTISILPRGTTQKLLALKVGEGASK